MRIRFAVLGFLASIPVVLGASQNPSAKDVVKAATAYVEAYQQQLTSIVADESYLQEIREPVAPDPQNPRSRQIAGEMFFMFADGQWLAIRDPALVDGRPVSGRTSAQVALRSRSAGDVARVFIEQNARWNIGRISRNFNEPTLALLVAASAHVSRFKFDRKAVVRTPEATLVTLAFTEKERPTLIRYLDGEPAYSKGLLVVEAETGRIRRTEFRVDVRGVRVEFITDYMHDQKLGMWVPSTFRERYERVRGDRELIVCQAVYANYRRFDTSARVK